MNKYLRYALGLALLGLAAVLIIYAIGLAQAGPETQLKQAAVVLAAFITGICGLVALTIKGLLDAQNIRLQALLDEDAAIAKGVRELTTNVVSNYAQTYFQVQIEPRLRQIEVNAQSAISFANLEYQEESRKRERRDAGMLKLSAAILKTTRAFKALTAFRPAQGESTEPLVNLLAQALATREQFLLGREELIAIRAMEPSHADKLKEYSALLINIIIDLRRDPKTPHENHSSVEYFQMMGKYESDLLALDSEVGQVLTSFLAVRHERPFAPDIPVSAKREA
jgi:hypothetical protein